MRVFGQDIKNKIFSCMNMASIEVSALKDKIVSIKHAELTASEIDRLTNTYERTKNKEKKADIDHILTTYSERHCGIINQSIAPAFLTKNKKISHKIKVDGYGKLEKFNKAITKSEYELLLRNVTTPLNKKQINPSSVKTPHSAHIDIASLVKFSEIKPNEKESILRYIQNAFLEGTSGSSSMKIIVEILKSNPEFKNVMPSIYEIVDKVPKIIHKTLANDNLYGRFFDSCFAEFILNNNNEDQNKTSRHVSDFLISQIPKEKFHEEGVLFKIKQMMMKDPQPWRSTIPEVTIFLDDPTKENFIAMLNSNHKYTRFLISSLGVKAMLSYPSLSEYKLKATERYVSEIVEQRILINSPNLDLKESGRSGLLLPYQNDGLLEKGVGVGIRPIDRYISPETYTKDSTHNINAIKKGRAIGIGLSGSSNLLESLFQVIKSKNDDFQVDTARLQAAAFLTHSGGHSINEAYNVFKSTLDTLIPLSYIELSMISPFHEEAILYAYDKCLEMSKKINTYGS